MAIAEEIKKAGVDQTRARQLLAGMVSEKLLQESEVEPFHHAKGMTDETTMKEFSKIIAMGLRAKDKGGRYREATRLVGHIALSKEMDARLRIYFREDATKWVKRVAGRRKGKIELRILTDALEEPYRAQALALQNERRGVGRRAYFKEGIRIRIGCNTRETLHSVGKAFGIRASTVVEGIGKLVEEKAIGIVEEKGKIFLCVMEGKTKLRVREQIKRGRKYYDRKSK